jgi:RecA-family ATPase
MRGILSTLPSLILPGEGMMDVLAFGSPLPMSTSPPQPVSAHELASKSFPPINFVVVGLIFKGLTILAGEPKVGKSWLSLNLALSIARGTSCLGDRSCPQGDVLYLALEDDEARLQRRIRAPLL